MLSAADIQGMRNSISASLTDTAQILRLSRTSDGMGGFVESWNAVASVPCHVASLPVGSAVEQNFAAQIRGKLTRIITMPAGTDIRLADRIVYGGRTFEVVNVSASQSYDLAARALVVEVL